MSAPPPSKGHVIALCGGVGGAKLAFGLTRILSPEQLTIVVNTGDDFVHLGLHVSPDIDTVVYTLADLADRERGWGLAGETWQFMEQLTRLGGEGWFNLGDRDLAMHVERTRRLSAGQTLSEITRALAAALDVRHPIVPMSDDPVRTVVQTIEGELAFQRYFVGRQCQPVVTGVRFDGAAASRPSPALAEALRRRDVGAVILCPSNPYLSIDPILAIPGVRNGLAALDAPVVAVSPIVGGRALKGPAAKLMKELGVTPCQTAIVGHYRDLLTGLIVDRVDAGEAEALDVLGLPTLSTATVMTSDDERVRLAEDALAFARDLSRRRQRRAS